MPVLRSDSFVFLSVDQNADGTKRLTLGFERRMDAAFGQVRNRGWLAQPNVVIDIPGPVSGWVALPDVSLVDAYAAGIANGGRRKRLPCAGARVGDRLTVHLVTEPPAGYVICDAVCTEAGWVRVGFVGPTLAIGASNTIPLKVSALRAA